MSKEVKAALITGIATILAALIALLPIRESHLAFLLAIVAFLFVVALLAITIGLLVARTDLYSLGYREGSHREGRRIRPAMAGTALVFAGSLSLAGAIALLVFRFPAPVPVPVPAQPQPMHVTDNCPPADEVVVLLERGLRGRFEGNGYVVEPAPVGDLVEGQEGAYYIIDLRSAADQKAWEFKLGEYTLDTFDRDFSRSVATFVRDIIRPLEGRASYRLYVRGSADIDRDNDFRGKSVDGYHYDSVKFFPAIGSDQYRNMAQFRSIPRSFTNNDLPFLRAAFMQEKLSLQVYGLKMPDILEGVVVPEEDEARRNATVFLFIEWPKADGPRESIRGKA